MTGRVLAIDLGTKRIGVAVSDATALLATPLTTIERSGSHPQDHRRIADLAREEEAVLVIVGLPIDLRGKNGPAAKSAVTEVARLATVLQVPVEMYDERLTSAAAHKQLEAQGLNAKQRRGQIDKFAAAVLLQDYLDGRARS